MLCRLLGDTADGGDGAGPGWLAVRPELPDCVLETALRHPHWRVRAALAERPGLPAGTLAALAADRERRVRRAAAAAGHRVALPPETLAALAADRDPDTRRLVPGCAGLPVELLVRLAQDGSPLVRAAAVGADSWAQLPPRVRTALRSDRDPAVRSAVQRALRVERPLPVTLAGYIAESDPLRRERTAAGPPWSGRSASGWCWTTIRGSAGRRRAIRGCRRIWRWPWRRIRTRRCGSRCRCGRT
ncbi:hypothetical protein KCH_02220 [Kitasatospora cheerisanensis KCTC 2395]|uniref:Leucine rich repeat variant n=1 Tax=Kitasatospora cheerisanensis KCTC 2395 TaxID=1348663 RepID=A0A066Z2I6_9ACTN|nr:hypothetical protein KCH_02220 [Kitasatospora cheerisanensis KCTC 2395]